MSGTKQIGDILPAAAAHTPPESFVFYKSFSEAISDCPDAVQLFLYKAITAYVFEGVQPQIEDAFARVVWRLVQPQLDANLRRRENGYKGGAPAGNKNARKQPKNNLKTT